MISSIFVVPFFIVIIYYWGKNKSFKTKHLSRNFFLYFVEYLKNNKIGLNTYSTFIHLARIFILVFHGFLRIFRIVLWHGILCKMIFSISDSIVEINLPTSYIKLYIEADNHPNEIFFFLFQ